MKENLNNDELQKEELLEGLLNSISDIQLSEVDLKPVEVKVTRNIQIPDLYFVKEGRFHIVTNCRNFLRFVKRQLVVLASYFAKKLGTTYNLKAHDFKIKGTFNKETLKGLTSKFVADQVVCPHCGSLDTERKNISVICFACEKRK
jgi:translation initiation factor 2 beta subunit (eIF-2beta)/eIF-5